MKRFLICLAAAVLLTANVTARADVIVIGAPDLDAYSEPAYNITMTKEEADLLRVILALEAQTEPMEGKKAVVEVIFNRVQSPEWPDTVYGVLSQKGQFATWKYRNRPYNTPGDAEDKAIAAVLSEVSPVLPDKSYVFFCTSKRGWMHDCTKIGRHYFGR